MTLNQIKKFENLNNIFNVYSRGEETPFDPSIRLVD